jgi:hypothetical protein
MPSTKPETSCGVPLSETSEAKETAAPTRSRMIAERSAEAPKISGSWAKLISRVMKRPRISA